MVIADDAVSLGKTQKQIVVLAGGKALVETSDRLYIPAPVNNCSMHSYQISTEKVQEGMFAQRVIHFLRDRSALFINVAMPTISQHGIWLFLESPNPFLQRSWK